MVRFIIKTFLTCLLLLIVFAAHSQEVNTTALKGFMQDAIDTKLSNTQIGDKFFCTNMLHRTDDYGIKARNYLEFALSNQRPVLRDKKIVIENLVFTRFNDLSTQEIPPKPFHIIGDTKNIYVGKYQGKIVIYFLVKEDKIASTLFLGQGDEHYFLDFCH